jgi:electron transfer flavoprotein beta subunit
MLILVPIKRVVDYNVRIRVKQDESGVELANVKMSMNPFDEIAVEAALRLKESSKASEVVVVSIGNDSVVETLRAGLAMGADRGIHMKTDATIQPLAAARLLHAVAQQEQPQLIITGKQAIDDDANQTGQMLAGLLGWGQGTFASQIKLSDTHALVTREIDGGLCTHELALPCVITTDLRLNEPRYASLPNIMKARSKPVATIEADTLGVNLTPTLQVVRVSEPPKRSGGKKVKDVAELLDKLRSEAKVIA